MAGSAFIWRVEAPEQNDAQAQAKADFREFMAKQFDTLPADERREFEALMVKRGKKESTIADELRHFELMRKAGLLSDEARSWLDKVEGSGGFLSQAEAEAFVAAHPEVFDRLVKLSLEEDRDSSS